MTVTVAELAAALRLGGTDEETAQVTRLLNYATVAVEKFAPDAPAAVQNEAVIRVAGWLFDAPTVTRSIDPLRASGAVSVLNPYRQHRAAVVGGQPAPDPGDGGGGGGVSLAAVNAAIASALSDHAGMPNVHHTPPDVPDDPPSVDLSGLEHRLDVLEGKTIDLYAGEEPGPFVAVTDVAAQGGLSPSFSTRPTLEQAQAVSNFAAARSPTTDAGVYMVRLPVAVDVGFYEVHVEPGDLSGLTEYVLAGGSWRRLGVDESFQYYYFTYPYRIETVTLRVRGNATHIGTSSFEGAVHDPQLLHRIETLFSLAADLRQGSPSAGWSAVTDTAVAGVAVGPSNSLAAARAATYLTGITDFSAGRELLIRLRVQTEPDQVRIVLTSDQGQVVRQHVASLHHLGLSADEQHEYWWAGDLGVAVASVGLEATSSAAHSGTSRFLGIFEGSLGDGIVGAAALQPLIAQRLLPDGTNDAQRGYRVARASNTDGYTLVPAQGGGTPTYTLLGTCPIANAKIKEFTSSSTVGAAFKAAWAAGTYSRFAVLLKIGGSDSNVSVAEFPSGFGLPNPIPSRTVTIRFALSHDNDEATDAYFQLTAAGNAWAGLIGEEAPASSVIELYGIS